MNRAQCLVFIFFLMTVQAALADCTPLKNKVKYQVQSGDHIASILRYFNMDPVFCKSCSLDQLLSANQIENKNLIQPGQILTIPFKCEEDTSGFELSEANDDRRVTIPRQIATTLNWKKKGQTDSIAIESVPNQVSSQNPLMHFGHNSIQSSDDLIFVSAIDGVKIENGKNDWSKIDCLGVFIEGKCLRRSNNFYATFKNSSLLYVLKDHLKDERYMIQSILSPGFHVGFNTYLNSKWLLHGQLELGYQSPYAVSALDLDSGKKMFYGGFFEVKFQPSDFYFGLGLRRSECLYFVPESTSVHIEAMATLYLKSLFGYQFLEDENRLFTSEFMIESGLFSSRHTLDFKYSQLIGLHNEYRMKTSSGYYSGGIDLYNIVDNTSMTQQSIFDLTLFVGMGWNFKTNY